MAKKPVRRQTAKKTGKSTQDKADPRDQILDAALKLIAERGWARMEMPDIAAASKRPLSEVCTYFPSKASLLTALIRRVDTAVLKNLEADEALGGESARDRLFDILMRRIDALAPYKAALIAIVRDTPRDPVSALCAMPRAERSMAWMLAGAGIATGGLTGLLAVKATGFVWAATLRTWFSDDDPDLARTMAALDRQLGRLCRLAKFCPPRHRDA